MNTLIDIQNNLLKYNSQEIIIILDDKYEPWFSGTSVANVLEYARTNRAIADHVDSSDKQQFINLKKFVKNIESNAQPKAVYINYSGLFSLILSSQMPKAKEFKHWVTSEVLPSIIKTGSYTASTDELKIISKLKLENKLLKHTVKVLKHNQAKTKYPKGGRVYVNRPANAPNKRLKKVGFTENMNDRLSTYGTSEPDNMDVLFSLEVDNPKAVEKCLKAVLTPYIYRDGREYYDCSTNKIKKLMENCNKMINGEFVCVDCDKKINTVEGFVNHSIEHNDSLDEKLYLSFDHDQIGGSTEEDFETQILEAEHKFLLTSFVHNDLFEHLKEVHQRGGHSPLLNREDQQVLCFSDPDAVDNIHGKLFLLNTKNHLFQKALDKNIEMKGGSDIITDSFTLKQQRIENLETVQMLNS